jgi:chaperonin GroEL
MNTGSDGEVVVEQILEKTGRYGYDARNGEYTDMVKAGILDPAKVVRIALQNAASVAGVMLTTEVLLTDLKDKDKNEGKADARAVR